MISRFISSAHICSEENSKGGPFCNCTEPIFVIFNCLVESGHEVEALEIALVALFQTYSLPKGMYCQARMNHRIEQLIVQLDSLKILKKQELIDVTLRYAKLCYDRWSSDDNRDNDMLPAHSFIRFMFELLLQIDIEFAFKFACLMLPINVNRNNIEDSSETTNQEREAEDLTINGVVCTSKSQIESQQAELAAVMLKHTNNNHAHLKSTLEGILEEIGCASHLMRLAKQCQTQSISQTGVFRRNLLEVAFELGVRTIRLMLDPVERRECIRWLVACSVETGKHAVEFLIRNWSDLFCPKEVACEIARLLTSQPVLFHLSLSLSEKDELLTKVRGMVIEASIRDPASCVMFALTLCEEHLENFDLICHIISQSSNRLTPAQLFSIGRYLESKQFTKRAFKVGMLALKQLDIGVMDDKHPAVCDILWVSNLATNLGIDELTQIVPVVVNCVHNPMVLTEVARRCSSPAFNKSKIRYSCNKEPLNRLVACAQRLFVRDIEHQLQTITPKSYGDFTKYLQKIQLAFCLSEDGREQFRLLLDYILTSQKGKKKLHKLVQHTVFAQQACQA